MTYSTSPEASAQNSVPVVFSLPHGVIIAGAWLGTHYQNEMLQHLAAIQLGLLALITFLLLLIPFDFSQKYLAKPIYQGDRREWDLVTIGVLYLLEWYLGVGLLVFSMLATFVIRVVLNQSCLFEPLDRRLKQASQPTGENEDSAR